MKRNRRGRGFGVRVARTMRPVRSATWLATLIGASLSAAQAERVLATELPEVPRDADCVVRGQVARHDVTWNLRTRLETVPSMKVREGQVTGWIRKLVFRDAQGGQDGKMVAVAQVENANMVVRALVGPEDLDVVLVEPIVVRGSVIPDGETDRRVEWSDDGRIFIQIGVSGAPLDAQPVACGQLGLERRELGTGNLLPPTTKSTIVRPNAWLWIDGGDVPVSGFDRPGGKFVKQHSDGHRETIGMLGELRGAAGDPKRRSISFRSCGGTVFGTVAAVDVLGTPTYGHGSNERCPGTGEHVFGTDRPIAPTVVCSRQIPLYVRTATLEDPVGFLKAGAHLRIDGGIKAGTELVSIPAAPIELLGPAHLTARVSDLAACR
jgi:hypothetical protein